MSDELWARVQEVRARCYRGVGAPKPRHVHLLALAQANTGTPDGTALRKRQLERELEDLARRHARRQVATPAYLAEHARLSGLLDAAVEPKSESPVVDPDKAVGWLANVKHLWRSMDDAGRRDLAAALYDRITVTSDGVRSVKLTPEAERHGAVLALPEVVIVARPEGLEHALPTIVIEGVDELVKALLAA